MNYVQAKKSFGQHFLKDKNIARKIVESLQAVPVSAVLEIGPGMGVLTVFLLERDLPGLHVIEIDHESVAYLHQNFPQLHGKIIEADFLKYDLSGFPGEKIAIIGNFPYNISSQIFFRVLEFRDKIPEVVGMVQKEVAERIAAPPGSKTYGILSVLLQAYYSIEYLFTVNENVFAPPPKVKSAVIRLARNNTESLGCDEILFKKVVKAAFNQRRKVLRNSLKEFGVELSEDWGTIRPEQLSVAQFVALTLEIEKQLKNR